MTTTSTGPFPGTSLRPGCSRLYTSRQASGTIPNMFDKRWFSDKVAEWVVTGILTLIGGGVLAFLKLHQSTWTGPVLYGAAGAFMVWVCCAAFIAVSRIPRKST